MANVYRKSRRTTQHLLAANTAAIEVGDLMYLASNAAVPFLSHTDNGSEEDNQAELARVFLGVSVNASPSGTTDNILVESGLDIEWEFTVVSGTHRFGDLLGASEASGTTVSSQVLEAVTSRDIALFKVSDDSSAARTTVKCKMIRNQFIPHNRRLDVTTASMGADLVLTFDSTQMQFLDPTTARNVDLPAVEESAGLMFWIANTANGAESITVRLTGGGATIAVLAQDEHGFFMSDGVVWVGTANTET